MKIEIVYEVTNSKKEVNRYKKVEKLEKLKEPVQKQWLEVTPQKYYVAVELEKPCKTVILDDDGDIVWENALPDTVSYICNLLAGVIFVNEKQKATSIGKHLGGEVTQFKENIDSEKIKVIKGENSYSETGDSIYVYGLLIIITRYLKIHIYKGTKEVLSDEKNNEVHINLKNVNDNYILEICYETSGKEKRTLFFNEYGEELELKLVPKKQE